MPKILFIITQSELGGAQRWVYDTAINLKDGYEIVVAAGNTGSLLKRLQEQNIRIISLQSLTRNIHPIYDFFGFIEIYRLLYKERPDVLQLCSTKAGFIGSIVGKLAGIKKIIYRTYFLYAASCKIVSIRAISFLVFLISLISLS